MKKGFIFEERVISENCSINGGAYWTMRKGLEKQALTLEN